MEKAFQQVVSTYRRRFDARYRDGSGTPFAIRSGDGQASIGQGEPACTFVVRSPQGLKALAACDLLPVGDAYLSGALDLEGDVAAALSLRPLFSDRHPLRYAWRFVRPRLSGQERSDREWIAAHYDEDPGFFTLWLDRRHRAYSHGVFEGDGEALEDGVTRKLDFAFDSAGIRPGARVLDVGGGWGAFTEYGGRRDVQVTSLTLSRQSEAFIGALIERERLPCRVLREHLFEHRPAERYDAIVVLGVTEHLPDYPRTLEKYRALLKPGGSVYLDASATRRKFAVSAWMERHVFPGNGSPMVLHDYLAAVAASPFQLVDVRVDTDNYARTARAWAERLDACRADVERRWGRATYRKFQLYLWGCVDGFRRDAIQAHRVVLRLPSIAS